jgi:uncharacterized protein (UPF0335 family)
MSEPTIGHNSKEQLQAIVDRIEHVEAEMKALSSDRGDIYKEADGNGFDVPALKAIVRARREDPAKRQAREAMIDLYRGTLGVE